MKTLRFALLLFTAFIGTAYADATINNMSPGNALTGSELFPMYQGSNPATSIAASAIKTYIGAAYPTNSPIAGNLAAWASATQIGPGNLSGDCTTSGTLVTTCLKTNGTAFGALATVTPGSNVATILAQPANTAAGVLAGALSNGHIFVGNSSNVAAAVALSGDCSITNTGVITCLEVNGVAFTALATTVPGTGVTIALGDGVNTTGGFGTVGTSGANVGLLNANKTDSGNNTFSGTDNFTGTFESGGIAQTFPVSGLLVGTTDTQTLTNKSIAASEVNSGVLANAQMQGNIGIEIDFNYSTTPTASATLIKTFSRQTVVAASAAIKCAAVAGATSSATVTLYHIVSGTPTSVGTLVFGASGSAYQGCTATFSPSVTFAAGDSLTVVFPASPDATLSNIAISVPATQ
jgi:hypothetical protein